MQPLQCVWQHHVAKTHLSTHMATKHDNNHAAIALQSATRDSRNAKKYYAHMSNHLLQNTEEEPIRARVDRSCTCGTHKLPFIADCSHFTRSNARFRAPALSPKQSLGNLDAAITLCFIQHHVAKTHLSMHIRRQQSCSHCAAICNQRFKKRTDMNNHLKPNTEEEPICARSQPHPPHTRGTFHRRLQETTQGFVLRLSPQSKAHATLMQPLQCVWQHHVAKTHLSTHMATKHDNNHAAIALQSATRDSRNAKKYYAHMSNHLKPNTEEEPMCARSQPHPPHTRGTFHRRLQETTQGFVLRLSPQSKAHATLMQPLQCVWQHHVAKTHLSTHMATKHDNNHAAIALQSATRDSRNAKKYYAHMSNHLKPNTEEEPIRARVDRSRTRRTHEVPFIAGCSHFRWKSTRFCAPASLQHKSQSIFMISSLTAPFIACGARF